MNQELSNEISSEIINSLILNGDMSKLSPSQQTQYYTAVCKSLDINPLTQPFAVMVLNGNKILYAKKDCTQQLSNTRKINTEVKSQKAVDSVYIVDCRATMPDGRFTDDIGVVAIAGLKGLELANAMMKSVTKAKRRAVLALCGLGMPDETEVEDMTHAAVVDNTKSRVENIIDAQATEVINNPKEEVKPKAEEKQSKKSTKTENKKTGTEGNISSGQLPEGHKIIQGVITTPAKMATVDRDGKPTQKWSFTMDDNKYGTFEESVFKGISAIMDLQGDTPILLNIEYKERPSGEKVLRDIVKFSQVTMKDVPI